MEIRSPSGRLDSFAASPAEADSGMEEDRTIAPDFGGKIPKFVVGQIEIPGFSSQTESRDRIARTAAEPRLARNSLEKSDVRSLMRSGSAFQQGKSANNDVLFAVRNVRSAAETLQFDSIVVGRLETEFVVKANRQRKRSDFMESVLPSSVHFEKKVELGRSQSGPTVVDFINIHFQETFYPMPVENSRTSLTILTPATEESQPFFRPFDKKGRIKILLAKSASSSRRRGSRGLTLHFVAQFPFENAQRINNAFRLVPCSH